MTREVQPQLVVDPLIDAETGSCTILVVDDSTTIRASLARTMPSDITIKEAGDGSQAWNILDADNNIDLVISDLDMPVMNGLELLRKMRSSGKRHLMNMPVIVLAGSEDIKIKSDAFIAGANDFVPKKFDKVELLARVRVHQKLAQTIRQLEESRRILKSQADTDALTGLINRRCFFSKTENMMALMQRQSEHFSIIMMDLDHFKAINDTYGHQAGDYVLKTTARVFESVVRESDVLARIGGEEFIIIAPYTNLMAGLVLAERLRKNIEEHEFIYNDNRLQVTLSLGLAASDPNTEVNLEALITEADGRLYTAKARGRNRVCASDTNEKLGELAENNPTRPKLEGALQMIEHGNIESLLVHLPYLLEKAIPLLELANDYGGDEVDLNALAKLIENIKSTIKD